MTILRKPVISVINLFSLAFLLPFELGNVRVFLKKIGTIGTKKAQHYKHNRKEKNPMFHFAPIFTIFFKQLKTRSRGLVFLANPLLLTT
jgi:hypothetical protein